MPNTLTNMLFAAALAVGATTTAQAGAAVFPDSRALGFGLPGEPHEALGRCMKVGQPCGGAIATTFGYHCCDGSVCDADETGTIGKCVIPVTKIRGRSPFDQIPVTKMPLGRRVLPRLPQRLLLPRLAHHVGLWRVAPVRLKVRYRITVYIKKK